MSTSSYSDKPYELTEQQKRGWSLPDIANGRWFAGTSSQAMMLEVRKVANEEDGLVFSWDMGKSKMFGFYPSRMTKEMFAEKLLEVPVGKRFCYEFLLKDKPCKFFVDFEWENGNEWQSHGLIKKFVTLVREKIKADYGIDADIVVNCGSRMTEDGFKVSFHIVCNNLIFENNQIVKAFIAPIRALEEFTWLDLKEQNPAKQLKYMVDNQVYSKNRNIRLAECCKGKPNPVPLRRYEIDNPGFVYDPNDYRVSIVPFFILNPVVCDGCVVVRADSLGADEDEIIPAGTKRPREMWPLFSSDPTIPDKELPVPLSAITSLLVEAGDKSTKMGAITYMGQEANNKWKIQGSKTHGVNRPCLMCPEKHVSHKSNNCLIFVEAHEGGVFRISYFCTDSDCYSSVKPILGYSKWDNASYSWKTTSTKEMLENNARKLKADVQRAAAVAATAAAAAAAATVVAAAADHMDLDAAPTAAWAASGGNALQEAETAVEQAAASGGEAEEDIPHDYKKSSIQYVRDGKGPL
jgi:hypothetical protein